MVGLDAPDVDSLHLPTIRLLVSCCSLNIEDQSKLIFLHNNPSAYLNYWIYLCTRKYMNPGILVVASSTSSAERPYWGQALCLRLERAGILDFVTGTEDMLDATGAKIGGVKLILITRLPEAAWTRERIQRIKEWNGALIVEGPVPDAVAEAVLGRRSSFQSSWVREPLNVAFLDNEAPIPLSIPPIRTAGLRFRPENFRVDATLLAERISARAAAYAAGISLQYENNGRIGSTAEHAVTAIATVAVTACRNPNSFGVYLEEWLERSAVGIAEANPVADTWPFVLAILRSTRWSELADKLDAAGVGPTGQYESSVWNWLRNDALKTWLEVTLGSGRHERALLFDKVLAGETATSDPVSSLFAAVGAYAVDPGGPAADVLNASLAGPDRFARLFRLTQDGAAYLRTTSAEPFVGLALSTIAMEAGEVAVRAGAAGGDAFAPAATWNAPLPSQARVPSSDGLHVAATARADDGGDEFPIILRSGARCLLTLPLFELVVQAHAVPPLDGTFISRELEPVRQLENSLLKLCRRLISDIGEHLISIQPWPNDHKFALTIAHDVDRVPVPEVFDRLVTWETALGIGSSWYWLNDRLNPEYMVKLKTAGAEIGLHANWGWNKAAELEAVRLAAGETPVGETCHGGAGADYWRGVSTVLHARAAGLRYTEAMPSAYGLPETGVAVVGADGCVQPVRQICLTHAGCTDRSPVKDDRVYDRKSFKQLAEAGGYCLLSNHPDLAFEDLQEWVSLLPLQSAWNATAATVADWWSRTHCREMLTLRSRVSGPLVAVEIRSASEILGLTLKCGAMPSIPAELTCDSDGACHLLHPTADGRLVLPHLRPHINYRLAYTADSNRREFK